MRYLLFVLNINICLVNCLGSCCKGGCCCCHKKGIVESNSSNNNDKLEEQRKRIKEEKLPNNKDIIALLNSNTVNWGSKKQTVLNDTKNFGNINNGVLSNTGNIGNINKNVINITKNSGNTNNGVFNNFNNLNNSGNTNTGVSNSSNNFGNMRYNNSFNNTNIINTNINAMPKSKQNVNNFNNAGNQNQNQNNYIYLFPEIGLNNIGSTCYMNAILQCLLHVSELTVYFLREYPNDKNKLDTINRPAQSRGKISNAFYKLVREVSDKNKKTYSPNNFKTIIGQCNGQFAQFEANDSKDLILYLMQTMHEELNYFGDKKAHNLSRPNQYDKLNTFMYIMNLYNAQNFSIISNIFYGTYESATLCHECKKLLYNYQKFEFISFGMFDYQNKVFDIYNGFKDNSKPQQLSEENPFYCNTCKKLTDSEITTNIIQPPNKLLINIDYGKNKAFKPSQVKFGEIIDITKFICFDFGTPIKYRLIGVCTHLGQSGSTGHYIAFCKNKETGQWYKFDDSQVSKCDKKNIYNTGNPYLLLYERIDENNNTNNGMINGNQYYQNYNNMNYNMNNNINNNINYNMNYNNNYNNNYNMGNNMYQMSYMNNIRNNNMNQMNYVNNNMNNYVNNNNNFNMNNNINKVNNMNCNMNNNIGNNNNKMNNLFK